MAFLEELGKTLTDTGKEVATKAKALTETIQLKTQISTENEAGGSLRRDRKDLL